MGQFQGEFETGLLDWKGRDFLGTWGRDTAGDSTNEMQKEGAELGAHTSWVGTLHHMLGVSLLACQQAWVLFSGHI